MNSFVARLVAAVAIVVVVAVTVGVGCASGDPSVQVPDAAIVDAEPSPQPPGVMDCDPDEHACGAICVDRQTNTPAVGCAFGCGAPCPTPVGASGACTANGTCDFTCRPGLARFGGACVAAACEQEGYACGQLVDEAGSAFDCGACVGGSPSQAPAACDANHQCVIAPDTREDNDEVAQATQLGDFNDVNDSFVWIENLSIDSALDEDWFQFHVADGFDYGNPNIAIELADRASALGWLDSAHELTVWFRCDALDIGSRVRCGEWFSAASENTLSDPALGKGCAVDARFVAWSTVWPSCTGIADHGTVTLRVRKRSPPRGDIYDLHVTVE